MSDWPGMWTESDERCPQCGGRTEVAPWWDDPPECGGAIIGTRHRCTECNWHCRR